MQWLERAHSIFHDLPTFPWRVGEISVHLTLSYFRSFNFTVPSARDTLSCLHLKVPGGFRVPEQTRYRIILSLNPGNSCPSYIVSMGTAPPKSSRPKVWLVLACDTHTMPSRALVSRFSLACAPTAQSECQPRYLGRFCAHAPGPSAPALLRVHAGCRLPPGLRRSKGK